MAEKTEKKVTKKAIKANDNIILIGQKPTMSYVLALITQFNNRNATEVNIKARGRSISRAVDVAEVYKNRFGKDTKVKDIAIGTDRVKTREGRETNVSTINICLAK